VTGEDHQDLDERTTDDRLRRRLATVLAALCVLALIGGVALVLWLRDQGADVAASERDRTEVMQAAERFTVEWNTFRPDEVDTYVERVAPLLSSKFEGEFTEAAPDVVAGITQQRLFSKGEVLKDGDGIPLVGISSIDNDSAEVLVVADANRVANRQRVLRHWRWQVSLIQVDGTWLVDEFEEV
jgi:Mce-associated membrane protein